MKMSIRFPNLGLDFTEVWKSLEIFGFEITFYGILICVGMLVGIWFVILETKRRNQDQNLVLSTVICALLGGFVGARLYYVAFSWSLYRDNWWAIFNVRDGGFAIYGGILGGAFAAWIFSKVKKIAFLEMADTACMGLLIGQIIGRWGDFFNRDSFGYYTDGLSAMALPLSSVDYRHVTAQMVEHQQTVGEITFIQAHPAFLYEIIWNLVLLILILGLRRRKRFQGEVFFIYLTGYGLGRFWIEGIRTDQLLISGTSLGVSCVLSAILVVIGSFTIIARETMERKRAKVRRQVSEVEYAEFTEETNGSIEGEDRSLEKQAGQPSDQQGGHSQESGAE